MHFHLPKPLHGWREFVGEVGIIVVGVLIALGAEQVVEDLRNHRQADNAMAAIRSELAHSAGVFDERNVVQQCLDHRLKQVDAIISEARRTGRLPDVSEIGRPPIRPIQSAAWSSAVSTDIVSHFGDEKRDALSMIYSQSSSAYDDIVAEQEMWATLKLLEHAPGPIDGALLAMIATTQAKLHFRLFLNGIDAQQLLAAIRAQGIQPDYFVVNETFDAENRRAMLELSRRRPVCQPLLVDGRPAA